MNLPAPTYTLPALVPGPIAPRRFVQQIVEWCWVAWWLAATAVALTFAGWSIVHLVRDLVR